MSLSYTKSKNKFVIKDGYFKYNVELNSNLTCQCKLILGNNNNNKYCHHIRLILKNEYKLSDFCIKYLHILDKIDWDNYLEFENLIINKLNNYECGICLCFCLDNKTDHDCDLINLFECSYCHNFVHKKCMNIWLLKNNNCIYCRL